MCLYPARISFQMTSPSAPTSNDSQQLVDDLSTYIREGGTPLSFVQEGVAQEAAVGLSVTDVWLNPSSQPSDYISRR